MKKPDPASDKRNDKDRPGSLSVVHADGVRQRFLRGVLTNDLVRRGVSFDEAYQTARAVRARLGDREEASTKEIRALVEQELDALLSAEARQRLEAAPPRAPTLQVVYHGQKQPFSRGLLARSIRAAGPEIDRAYQLVTELEAEVRSEGIDSLSSDEIARRMAALLERTEGVETAGRYRLVRRIHRLPRPLVIYIGGASGTGKSTLALELAPLFRIYRITATDTIRQVMRMVFTPAILPALHTSSFEIALDRERPDLPLGDPREQERLIGSFEEQATRVCVGVRAVVERAIAENMSIVVEGVHLHPGLVPFPDLEGAAYQVPLILSTLEEEVHRPRFLMRSRLGRRGAERYLENFGSIRAVHDYLLQQAEIHDVAALDTSEGEPLVTRTMRVLTDIIERQFPQLARTVWSEPAPRVPTLVLCIDGLADRPVRALGGRTPLQAAATPVLDRLAREGRCGLADPVAPGVVPDTAAGSLAVMGQSPLALKRGPVEALGAGIDLRPGDLALRGNFATLDEQGRVLDRRAGRIRSGAEELAAALDRLPLPGVPAEVEVQVKVSTEHRLAVVLRGEGLSSAIRGSDPGDGAGNVQPLTPRPIDPHDERAAYTAGVLSLFEQEARSVLESHPVSRARVEQGLVPVNAVLTRGAGVAHRLIPLEDAGAPLRLTCVAGDSTMLGIASLLGAELVTGDGMTANLDTDLDAKFEAVATALGRSDLVVLHVKGADIAAHDRRPERKVEFLERLDAGLGRLLDAHTGTLRVAVASDHATLSESGQHAADPLPVLIWGTGIEADQVTSFDEQSAGSGAMRRFPLQILLGRLFELR